MSSGGQQTNQTSGLSSAASPYLGQFASAVGNALNLPYEQYPGQMVANLSPLQTGAMGSINSLMYGLPAMDTGAGTLNTLAMGAGNPGLNAVNQTTIQDATRAYNNATAATNSQFNAPGIWGGDRQQIQQDLNNTDLARGLAQGLSTNNYNNFNTANQTALQATGAAGNLYSTLLGGLGQGMQAGSVDQNQNQNLINSAINQWTQAYQYPWTQLGNASSAAAPLFGVAPRTTTTTGPAGNPVTAGLGTIALGNYLGLGSGSTSGTSKGS